MTPRYNKNIIEFTMGADPELVAFDKKGNLIRANDHIQNSASQKFGADGNGVAFELRPEPSENPLKIVTNIRDILVNKFEECPNFLKWSWKAGSHQGGQPLGGHIHFGITKEAVDSVEACAHLSQYLGALNLLIEDNKQARSRRGGSYGSMEDVRVQKWGFEYRTLSSWLSSPSIAAANLCLAKTIMDEIINNKNWTCGYFVNNTTFKEVNIKQCKKHFDRIWDGITNMRLYPKYKKYIDIFHYLVTNNKTWITKGDIKPYWGIIDTRLTGNEEMSLDSIWGDSLQELKPSPRRRTAEFAGIPYGISNANTIGNF